MFRRKDLDMVQERETNRIIQDLDYGSRLEQQRGVVPGHGLLIFQRAVALHCFESEKQVAEQVHDRESESELAARKIKSRFDG